MEHSGASVVDDAEEAVLCGRRLDCVDSNVNRTVGSVFESDGHGESAHELAVCLRFRRASADRRPADEVGEVLRDDRIEKLGRGRDLFFRHCEKQLAGETQSLFDVEGLVQIGVVDHAFPADGGARFFEVGAHDENELRFHLLRERLQTVGVVDCGVVVVDAARTCDDEQTLVAAVNDVFDCFAGARDEVLHLGTERQFGVDFLRSRKRVLRFNVDVVYALHFSRVPSQWLPHQGRLPSEWNPPCS